MGMKIEKAIDIMERYEMYGFNAQKDGCNKAIDTMHKYQQLQADYEKRLKADLKTILIELQLEIEETTIPKATVLGEIFWNMGADAMKEEIETRIQQKINSLKEENTYR